VYATQAFSQKFVGISLNIENLEYGNTGLVSKNVEKLGSSYVPNSFHIKLGNFEAKETENIWLGNLAPHKLEMKSPYVKNIELNNDGSVDEILYV
jgi:hypothetical protein